MNGGAGPSHYIDHVAIAVHSLSDALSTYLEAWGATFIVGGDNPTHDMRTVQLQLAPGTKIELLTPLSADSPLRDHLQRFGEGVHHITVIGDSLDALVDAHRNAGDRISGYNVESENWKEAFVLPGSTGGVLIQLAQSPWRWDVPVQGLSLGDVLNGRVTWDEFRPAIRCPDGTLRRLGTEAHMRRGVGVGP